MEQEPLDRLTDGVLRDVGGFGRFQFLIACAYFLYNKSVMLIVLSLSFLEKVPSEYLCLYEDRPD